MFCALQPSRYLPQEIKVIILASISNSECSDTGLFWLRMWVFLKWSMVITDELVKKWYHKTKWKKKKTHTKNNHKPEKILTGTN